MISSGDAHGYSKINRAIGSKSFLQGETNQ